MAEIVKYSCVTDETLTRLEIICDGLYFKFDAVVVCPNLVQRPGYCCSRPCGHVGDYSVSALDNFFLLHRMSVVLEYHCDTRCPAPLTFLLSPVHELQFPARYANDAPLESARASVAQLTGIRGNPDSPKHKNEENA
jgi:hypothetical protein